MSRKILQGDRFRHTYDEQGYIRWVIYEYVDYYRCVVIESNDFTFWPVDHQIRQWLPENDEYLGNYSKINNFNELYNLLNED